MYIIELISKWIEKEKQAFKKTDGQISFESQEEPAEKCEHVFLPIDSTKKVLSCTKCGYVLKISDKDLKKKNFFIN